MGIERPDAGETGADNSLSSGGHLERLLDRLAEAGRERDEVDLRTVVGMTGQRSFGPVVLVGGLIAVSPLSGIPGVPTTIGLAVALIAAQILLRRPHFWLPDWLLRRRIPSRRLLRALELSRPTARVADRLVRPRLPALTRGVGLDLIALVCLVIGAVSPTLELVPFSATIAGAALTAFGLALIAEDGALGLVALLVLFAVAGLVVHGIA